MTNKTSRDAKSSWAERLKLRRANLMRPRGLLLVLTLGAGLLFVLATVGALRPVNESFENLTAQSRSVPLTDRHGQPLAITYQSDWNTQDVRPLYAIPELMKEAFLFSEDRRFFDHNGVDWQARIAALRQNIASGKTVRGASTITEQVVRMINPRPRTLWSKWLEGIEAALLEKNVSKAAIFEFYLNQLPYAANRRGVTQAARHYFNRDLDTLSPREIFALVILARAPSAYDLYRHPQRIDDPLQRLLDQMVAQEKITPEKARAITAHALTLERPYLPVEARHFVRHAALHNSHDAVRTTLDAGLQARVQSIIDARLKSLAGRNVNNAGALVIDHHTNEILAWVVGGAENPDTAAGDIDTITTPRQPGSTLKPFLYAMALEKGWTAATMINDAPVAEAIGSGLHRFRNYSNTHYGPLPLRDALGNSLNIPAILTINYVGTASFLSRLHVLGFESLDRGAQIYDEGLALGNGEVTLYELARAYSALAHRGQYRDFTLFPDQQGFRRQASAFSPETASLIGHIMADPHARTREFGQHSVLNLPHRTAIKTGTSTDYRDAWTIGYNDRYTVAIWMGNLDRTPMKEVTGSTGPALALRSIFNILNQGRDPQDIYISPALIARDICIPRAKDFTAPATPPDAPENSAADGDAAQSSQPPCTRKTELFLPGTEEAAIAQAPLINAPAPSTPRRLEMVRPTAGLMMAYDPRIPASHQKFRFELATLGPDETVEWVLNGKSLGRFAQKTYLWPLEKGEHRLYAVVSRGNMAERRTPEIPFIVK